MCMGPVFKLIHLFPFTVSNVTIESIREPMNMRLLFHTDVFAALSTTKVVPSESNNNGGQLPTSVVIKTVQLPVLMQPVLWRCSIIFNAH